MYQTQEGASDCGLHVFSIACVESLLRRMPELKTSYFGFPTGDMIERTTHCKEWFHDCCKIIPKKYFKIDSLDYFCKICEVNLNKSMSLSN